MELIAELVPHIVAWFSFDFSNVILTTLTYSSANEHQPHVQLHTNWNYMHNNILILQLIIKYEIL